jgi:hypothetical protein
MLAIVWADNVSPILRPVVFIGLSVICEAIVLI